MTYSPTTSDLYDKHGDALSICDVTFRQFGALTRFGGPIATFRAYEDNLVLKSLLKQPGEGRVMVVDTAGSSRCAMLGDNMAQHAVDAGWAGIVVNGAVRDAAALRALPIGIRALYTNPRRSRKDGTGESEIPVVFGGVVFRPGDQLVADDDGVVVLPANEV
jgi:regulator of ribonuclease activity A